MSSSVINPCYPNIPFLYPFKISENQGFSDVSKRIYKWSIGLKWVKKVPTLKFLFKNNKGNTGKNIWGQCFNEFFVNFDECVCQ